tara:strand:+ start:808 stop:1092 length:285 start_codon:yes stop_codon:yes gene_type:complete
MPDEFVNKLPKHDCGLYIEHNPNRDSYQNVQEWIEVDEVFGCPVDWKNDEQKQRAITANEVWTLRWYPNTPISNCYIASPTLGELLEFAAEYVQ